MNWKIGKAPGKMTSLAKHFHETFKTCKIGKRTHISEPLHYLFSLSVVVTGTTLIESHGEEKETTQVV